MNIVQFFKSKLVPIQNKSTFSTWIVPLKALFDLRLTKGELPLWRQCTNRENPPKGPFRELWCVVGRRGGKSFMASVIADFNALS